MDFWKRMAIHHRYHVFYNPLSGEKVDEIIELLRPPEQAQVLDIGCGNAEFLCRVAERWSTQGTGVDISPQFIEIARAKLAERGLKQRIRIVEGDGAKFAAEPESFDVTSCLGASWIFGGHAGTVEALASLTRPGGLILLGEPFWRVEPSPEHLEAAKLDRDAFSTHHGNVEIGARQGLWLLHTIVSSLDDWDRYEGYQRYAVEMYATENPNDPDLDELLSTPRNYHEDVYLRWGRKELGWAMYLFKKFGALGPYYWFSQLTLASFLVRPERILMGTSSSLPEFDAIVIGAGFSGLYAVYKLREKGLKVRALEAGSGVGGTWYWNRYPGARTDSQSYVYQYWFSPELLDEWDWSERFPAQEETERYLNFVADKFELRQDIQFNTRVTAADYDEKTRRWTVTTEAGEELSAQFIIMATGGLSENTFPNIPGVDTFRGESHHTARWPASGVDFSGKRVGIIGTGATGIQVIQTIAPEVGHLTVFQRTPNYTIPMRNPKFDDEIRAELRARYPRLREHVHETFAGFDYDFDTREFASFTPEERRERMEELWLDGSLSFWVGSYAEVLSEEEANREFTEFVREKIRARINAPRVADLLVPSDHGFGTRRVPLENQYYEAFNQDNVLLIDVNETPIERITPTGIRTSTAEFPLDILIYATGFDAGTGALTSIDIRGRGGKLLRDTWSEEVHTFMGLQVSGYPNMFTTMAPMSPSAAYCNVPTCAQQQVDWIADCISFVRDSAGESIEPTQEAQDAWVAHHDEVGNGLLAMKTRSWHVRTDSSGNQQRLLAYAGGASNYRKLCEEVKRSGYDGLLVT